VVAFGGGGATLVARAEVTRSAGREAVARCDLSVVDAEGAETAVAFAQGTVVLTGG
jgi:hypothetical protein